MEKKIEVAYVDGLWIIGEREGRNINNPRLYLFSGNQHAIMNLPASPKTIRLEEATFWYLCDEEISELYIKQVEQSHKPSIIMPGKKIEVVK